jgi:C1A family cysteine protease
MSGFIPAGLGWQRDLPDVRDFATASPRVRAVLHRLKRPRTARAHRPSTIDWREYCPPIRDQGNLASCTAHACLGLFEYFERRASGNSRDGSRLFLYQMTRRLLQHTTNAASNLRATLKAMIRFGIPPERHWPYDTAKSEAEPAPFLFSFAQESQSITYLRLDPRGSIGAENLLRVKSFLAAGLPSVFGFSVVSSVSGDPAIAYPTCSDSVQGGHAVLVVGYDDSYRIRSTKGALLIHNSWGTGWGDGGYGWLPYAYLEQQLAVDCWTMLKPSWLDSGEFGQPA